MKKPNYTYIECHLCNRKGTPRCRRKGYRWSPCVIRGCMELVEDAPKFLKASGLTSSADGKDNLTRS